MKESNRRKHERLRRRLLGNPGSSTAAAIEAERILRAEEEARAKSEPKVDEASPREDEAMADDATAGEPEMATASTAPHPRPTGTPPVVKKKSLLPWPDLETVPPAFTPDADHQRRIEWLDAHARFRLRTAEDCYWERSRAGRVLHEYDVLGEESFE